jgi:hypothetical protein
LVTVGELSWFPHGTVEQIPRSQHLTHRHPLGNATIAVQVIPLMRYHTKRLFVGNARTLKYFDNIRLQHNATTPTVEIMGRAFLNIYLPANGAQHDSSKQTTQRSINDNCTFVCEFHDDRTLLEVLLVNGVKLL